MGEEVVREKKRKVKEVVDELRGLDHEDVVSVACLL